MNADVRRSGGIIKKASLAIPNFGEGTILDKCDAPTICAHVNGPVHGAACQSVETIGGAPSIDRVVNLKGNDAAVRADTRGQRRIITVRVGSNQLRRSGTEIAQVNPARPLGAG